jgi:hypothetical protein
MVHARQEPYLPYDDTTLSPDTGKGRSHLFRRTELGFF